MKIYNEKTGEERDLESLIYEDALDSWDHLYKPLRYINDYGNPSTQNGSRKSSEGLKPSFYKRYELARSYYNHFGNLDVPGKFVTEDGIHQSNSGIDLGEWLDSLRSSYEKGFLSSNTIEKLNEIGMDWNRINLRNRNWLENYELAKQYYNKFGNLAVPYGYSTEDGHMLGKWITRQRIAKRNKSLSIEFIKLLDGIGMLWEPTKHKNDIQNICLEYNIDYQRNHKVLAHMPVLEFKVKILHLIDVGKPIIDKKGKLHEIFSLSSIEMEKEYGLSLSEMINIYGKKEYL